MFTKAQKCMLIIASVLCVASCSKPEIEKDTTYTINYQINNSSFAEQLPGASYKESIIVREYNDNNECIDIRNVGFISYGDKKLLTANKNTEKITVRIKLDIQYNGKEASKSWWVQHIYVLEHNTNNNVYLDGHTIIGDVEPIK